MSRHHYKTSKAERMRSKEYYRQNRAKLIAKSIVFSNRLKDVDIRNLLEKVSPATTPFRLVRRVKLPSVRRQFVLPAKIAKAKKNEIRRLKGRKYTRDWQRLHRANLRLLKILKQAEQA